jgi:hypothetical protein
MHSTLLFRFRPRLRTLVSLGAMTLSLAACSDEPFALDVPEAVDRVEVSPNAATLQVGQSHTLRAAPAAADGRILLGRQIDWSSSDSTIASVDALGAVVAKKPGAIWITARSGGRSGTARIDIFAPTAPVASIEVQQGPVTVQRGGVRQLQAVLRAADGTVLHGRHLTWSSGSPGAVSVDTAGRIIAYHLGTAWITVASEGKTARVEVIVEPAPEYHLRSAGGSALPADVYSGSYTLPDGTVRQVRGTVTDGFLWLTDDGRYLMTVMRISYEDGVARPGNAFYDQGEYTRSASGELHFRSIGGMPMSGGISGRVTQAGVSLTHRVYMDGPAVTFEYEKQ